VDEPAERAAESAEEAEAVEPEQSGD